MSGRAGYANCHIMGCFLENALMQGTAEKKTYVAGIHRICERSDQPRNIYKIINPVGRKSGARRSPSFVFILVETAKMFNV